MAAGTVSTFQFSFNWLSLPQLLQDGSGSKNGTLGTTEAVFLND